MRKLTHEDTCAYRSDKNFVLNKTLSKIYFLDYFFYWDLLSLFLVKIVFINRDRNGCGIYQDHMKLRVCLSDILGVIMEKYLYNKLPIRFSKIE